MDSFFKVSNSSNTSFWESQLADTHTLLLSVAQTVITSHRVFFAMVKPLRSVAHCVPERAWVMKQFVEEFE